MFSPGKNNSRLHGLDHLRSSAIVLVLLFHYRLFPHPAWLDSVGAFGWTGVDLFFVLSGYLISSHLFAAITGGKGLDLGDFYTRRFFRILPAYLVVVALYYVVPAFVEWGSLPPLWRLLTFTQNFGLDLRLTRAFSHAWSLCIEEQFYLLLPFCLLLLVRYHRLRVGVFILFTLFIGGFMARLCSWYHMVVPAIDTDGFMVEWYKWIYYPTYNRLDGLLAGISLAALVRFRPVVAGRLLGYGDKLIIAALTVLAAAYFVCMDEHGFAASIFGFPLVALGYGLLVAAAISPSCVLCRYSFGATVHIATLSYAVYLSHKGVIHLTQQWLGGFGMAADGNMVFLFCMAATWLGAWLLNRIVERPFLILRSKLLKTRL